MHACQCEIVVNERDILGNASYVCILGSMHALASYGTCLIWQARS